MIPDLLLLRHSTWLERESISRIADKRGGPVQAANECVGGLIVREVVVVIAISTGE